MTSRSLCTTTGCRLGTSTAEQGFDASGDERLRGGAAGEAQRQWGIQRVQGRRAPDEVDDWL